MNKKCMECSEMQEYAKKCSDIFARVFATACQNSSFSIFPFFLLPKSSVSGLSRFNTCIVYRKKKQKFLLICPLRPGGGVVKSLSGHVRG